ncbi:unnamed protein product [Gordionus sp. m RMFG-2023]
MYLYSNFLISVESCTIERCAEQYTTAVSDMDITQGSNPGYCHLLKYYRSCLENDSKSCRGNLNFHSTRSLVSQWFTKYDCEKVLARSSSSKRKNRMRFHNKFLSTSPDKDGSPDDSKKLSQNSEKNSPSQNNINRMKEDALYYEFGDFDSSAIGYSKSTNKRREKFKSNEANRNNRKISSASHYCNYNLHRRNPPKTEHMENQRNYNDNYFYCALFGDPHLIKYDNTFETCRISKAWPLVNNPYFGVQVTSEAVIPSNTFYATAITQITVIIKQHYPCAEEKTYEARVGHVPSTFIDGSNNAGMMNEKSVYIKERALNNHIDIKLKYIGAVISIRLQKTISNVKTGMPDSKFHTNKANHPDDNYNNDDNDNNRDSYQNNYDTTSFLNTDSRYLSVAIRIPREFASFHAKNTANKVLEEESSLKSRFSTPSYFSRQNVLKYWESSGNYYRSPSLSALPSLVNRKFDSDTILFSTLELCSSGCPKNEIVDMGNFFRKALTNPQSDNQPTLSLKLSSNHESFTYNNYEKKKRHPNEVYPDEKKTIEFTIIQTQLKYHDLLQKMAMNRSMNYNYTTSFAKSNNGDFSSSREKKLTPHDENSSYIKLKYPFIGTTTKNDMKHIFLFPIDKASAVCRNYEVTDVFFDACVYDLLNTGDTSFSRGSQIAYLDYVRLQGGNKKNKRLKLYSPTQNKFNSRPNLPLIHHNRTRILFEYPVFIKKSTQNINFKQLKVDESTAHSNYKSSGVINKPLYYYLVQFYTLFSLLYFIYTCNV